VHPLLILYEDNHLIAVFKPAGLLVQGDITGDTTLIDIVKNDLKNRYQKPGQVYLGLVHRLDRVVSGVVIFAKTSKAASRLCEQIRQRQVEKKYMALVKGQLQAQEKKLTHWLVYKNEQAMVFNQPTQDAQEACLYINTLEYSHIPVPHTYVDIQLITGRKHQIRAQLAAIGYPIMGDNRYGYKTQQLKTPANNGRIGLVCYQMTITHPTAKTPLKIQLPDALIGSSLQEFFKTPAIN